MPDLCHFEVPFEDYARAKKFYHDIFGWEITDNSGEWGEYYGVKTSANENAVMGGMMKKQAPEHMLTVYFCVDSVDDTAARIREYGGNVVMEKTEVKGVGYFAIVGDTEGNYFGIWESSK